MPRVDAAACAGLLEGLTAIVVHAALVIRASAAGGVRRKDDGSPVTVADIVSERGIRDALLRMAPGLPIISEEEEAERWPAIAATDSYFLVDPLDGTREYIAGRDEYTVNIALMTDGAPIMGVIAAPALGLIWRGIVGNGAERLVFAANGQCSQPSAIRVRPRPQNEVVVLVSRSHLDTRTQSYLNALPQPRTIACGSSVKFCRIAEGTADLYPRLAPTHDWDVAAGHAILVAAGGRMLRPDGGPIVYGTAERLIPDFIASGA